MTGQPHVVGDGTTRRCSAGSGETCAGSGERRRSQSLRSTEAARAARSAESKAAPREGRQEGGGVSSTTKQSESQAPAVPERATQGAKTRGRDWTWVEASVWNERMLAALENGVQGGKWFSLIDKVYRASSKCHESPPSHSFSAQLASCARIRLYMPGHNGLLPKGQGRGESLTQLSKVPRDKGDP